MVHGPPDCVTATVPVIVVEVMETTHGDVDCVTATVPEMLPTVMVPEMGTVVFVMLTFEVCVGEAEVAAPLLYVRSTSSVYWTPEPGAVVKVMVMFPFASTVADVMGTGGLLMVTLD